jgi:hypothetical protein
MMRKPDRAAAALSEMPTEHAVLEIILVDESHLREPIVYAGRPAGWAGEPVRWFLKVRDRWRHPGRGQRAGSRTGRPAAAGKEIPPVEESTSSGMIFQHENAAAEDPVTAPGTPDNVIAALYLEAEQVCLSHETPYDTDDGLQRFNAWLDDQMDTH